MRVQPRLISNNELYVECAGFVNTAKRFIQEEMTRLHREGLILELNGSVESAVVAVLAEAAVGPQRVMAVIMKDQDSHLDHFPTALGLARSLRIRHKTIDITPMLVKLGVYRPLPLRAIPVKQLRDGLVRHFYKGYTQSVKHHPMVQAVTGTKGITDPWINEAIAYHRAKARQRMVTLYYHAELENLLVLNSVNKTERKVGMFVKHGNIAADVAPLANLFQTQVRQVAKFLELPEETLSQLPPATVLPGVTDEHLVGLPYELLDRILLRLERGMDPAAIAAYLGIEAQQVEYVRLLCGRSRHLRVQPGAPSVN